MEQNNADIKKSDLTRVYTSVRKFLAEKDFDSALQALDEILEKDTGNAEALALAGDIYTAAGDTQLAIGHYGLAIQAAPTNVEYKRQFISIAGKITIAQYNPAIEEVLRLCLEAPEVECSHAQILWYTLVRAHPQFLPLLQAAFENPERPFEGAQKLDFLLNPLFLMGIKRI